MDNTETKETDYLQNKISEKRRKLGKRDKLGFFVSERKDFNPFRNVYSQSKYIFVVDWQVCDKEHLGEENLPEDIMF